jgi:hypothetical protein
MSTPYTPAHLNQWQPGAGASGWDSAANYIGADLSAFYVAPIGHNPSTVDSVTRSNWRTVSAALDAVSGHEETGIKRIGHWACGWFEIYLVHRDDTPALRLADTIAARLADYCVFSDDDLSELEQQDIEESYADWMERDFKALLIDALETYAPADAPLYWADDIISALDDDAVEQQFWKWCADDTIACEHVGDGPSFILPKPADVPRAELAQLTGLALLHPDQEWRREPYPWPGATPSPLEPPLIAPDR